MTPIIQRIHDIGAVAWVRFVQALNWIAVSLFGGIVVVQQAYPGVIANAVQKLPPWVGIPAILIFGIMVHYALRRAAKNAA
jgi:hypothetical protein